MNARAPTRMISVRMPVDLLERLAAESELRGVDRTTLLRQAVRDMLDGRGYGRRCPVEGCGFSAPSATARCPVHNRRVAE